MICKKRGQVWVETAIYTLIGLTIIAIVLSVAIPQIEKIKDREIIKQTINALDVLDSKIAEARQTKGNIRIIDFKIAKGRFELDAEQDVIRYILEDTNLKLSEVGIEVKEGDITLRTEEYGKNFNIFLTINYTNTLDLTYNNKSEVKVLQPGTTPYRIQIENRGDLETGDSTDNRVNIDFEIH